MAVVIEEVTVKVKLRDGENDHNRQDIANMIRKMIEYGVHHDIILGDSFEEEVLDDLISVEVK